MWKIGNVEVKSRVVLAPMAGVTSLAYRNFMKKFGVGLTVTEMVSDCGLIYGNDKTIEYLKTSEEERPVAVQLFGGDADNICKAIDVVLKENPQIDIIDINLGCPVPKVTKTGAGSALLKSPKKLYEYMKKICDYSPLPVTAKIRLGWDEKSINFLENIRFLEKAGVKAIGIHTRTAKQGYSGKANYEIIRDLQEKMSVPLIISGDIYSLENTLQFLDISKATAIMVARGGVGHPRLISQIVHYFETGEKLPNATISENINYLIEFADMLIEEKGEYKAMMLLRGIAPKFLDGYPNTKKARISLAQSLTTRDSLMRILGEIDK